MLIKRLLRRYYHIGLILFLGLAALAFTAVKPAEIALSASSNLQTFNKVYKLIDEKYKLSKFSHFPKTDRCLLYFKLLIQTSPNWSLDVNNIHDNDSISHLNVYNQCCKDSNIFNALKNEIPDIDHIFNPYLTFKLPIFQQWNGISFYGPQENYDLKLSDTDINTLTGDSFTYSEQFISKHYESIVGNLDQPFWNFYGSKTHGQGIVISVYDDIADILLKLIGNLRLLDNDMPLHLVFRKNGLSNENKLKIVKAARSDKLNKKTNQALKKLNIWFVDLSYCLQNDDNLFDRFYNKILAYSFSGFKEILLMDVDVLLFQNPAYFFRSSQYEKSGTLFFKDRNYKIKIDNQYIDFIKSVIPNKLDNILFGINSVDDAFFDSSEYFRNKNYHYMESGLVLLNKHSFSDSIPMILYLTYFENINSMSWGDKELYWISLLLSGYFNYEFNDHWAVAVGNPYTNPDRIKFQRICTSQPAHILSDTNELVWINSGISKCKRINDFDSFKEFDLKNFNKYIPEPKINKDSDLMNYYLETIEFNAYIEPPQAQFQENINPSADGSSYVNVGWGYTPLCLGYIWCATDILGDYQVSGTYHEFKESQIQWYTYIRDNY